MKYLLGRKSHMTQLFTEEGVAYPVTAVKAGPVSVTQVKTTERDGYNAVQIGFEPTAAQRVNKAQRAAGGESGPFRVLRECRFEGSTPDCAAGDVIDASVFAAGERVMVSATSKGKGFQGTVKRWNFGGGPRTHGQKHSEREPGSIGGMGIQRVMKGTKMAGRMGSDRVTLKKRQVVAVDAEHGILYIKGAVPGRVGATVEIRG